MSWETVCKKNDIQEDFPYSAKVDGKEIGVYCIDGEYYALEDVCPHAYALLSQGFVEDGQVECPLHEAVFDIKTGQCLLAVVKGADTITLFYQGIGIVLAYRRFVLHQRNVFLHVLCRSR